MLSNVPRMISLLVLVLGLVAAQRFTTTNTQGLTIVASRTIDDDGDTITRTLSTIGRIAPTSTRTLVPTTTSGFTTQSYNGSPTAVVQAGTILDYTSYKSRIDSEVASMSASKLNAFVATAAEYGLRPVSSGHQIGVSAGAVYLMGIAVALAFGSSLV